MKQSHQISFPFVEKSSKEAASGLSLNQEKFIQYLTKSIEIEVTEAKKLYAQIEEELKKFHGPNPIAFLERILSSKIEPFPVKKSATVKPRVSLTPNARIVLEKRYLLKNDRGQIIETPEQLFERVAKAIALADRLYKHNADTKHTEEKFYQMLSQLEFLPNSPTLMNAGTELGQLSACFVLPIEDSMESIFETLKNTAIIQKSGGGTGFNFSKLRPKNSPVVQTQGVSSGPLSFISIFNAVTDTIKQGGTRRGANMAILNVDHPDILEFIHSKETPGNLVNFNISVSITEEFMEVVKSDKDYSLIDPATKKTVGELNAKSVFDQIIKAAWKTGDPGLIFIDAINRANPTLNQGNIESTNPCGEQVLLPYESCNLGSINLNTILTPDKTIDWNKLERITKDAVHFLDNVIDVNMYPIPQIEQITKTNRKIGLGIMGLADVLIQKNISYNSEEALKLSEEIMSFIHKKAHEASEDLAQERGSFPNFKNSIHYKIGKKPLRNATVTTIAPTGTISIIAGCSSGIEPVFARSFVRHVLEGESLPESYSQAIVTAHDIEPEWHIRMQALFQKYSDSAVSKTLNLPHSATPQDVQKAYWLAYELKCKGITVYRDRSKETQVLNLPKDFELSCPECQSLFEHQEGCTFCRSCGYMKCS